MKPLLILQDEIMSSLMLFMTSDMLCDNVIVFLLVFIQHVVSAGDSAAAGTLYSQPCAYQKAHRDTDRKGIHGKDTRRSENVHLHCMKEEKIHLSILLGLLTNAHICWIFH